MKEAGSYRFQNASLSLTFFIAYRYKKRFLDEVIGVTNGYGCGNRRKSGTVGYLLNQSSDEPSTTTTGGGKASTTASLPRRFFLATSFSSGWLGKQATFSIGKIPINNRPEWWGRRPSLLQWKGGPFHSRSSTTTFRPGDIVGEQCRGQGENLPLVTPFKGWFFHIQIWRQIQIEIYIFLFFDRKNY